MLRIYSKPFVLVVSSTVIPCSRISSAMPPSSKVCGSIPVPVSTIKLCDGRRLAYKEQGVSKDVAKYKAIVVHGYDSSKEIYLPLSQVYIRSKTIAQVLSSSGDTNAFSDILMQEFVENHGLYIVTFDRPGYGDSDPNPKRTVKSDTFDVQELADHLNLGPKFYVVGVSLGNYISWGFLKYLPHRLAGAALVVPVINYWWSSFPPNLVKEEYKRQPKTDQIKLWIAHHAPGLIRLWMTQSWLPYLSSSQRHPLLLNNTDVEILNKMTQVPALNEIKIRKQGENESLYRDMKVAFGKWEFDPMELESRGNEGCVHLWQGYEDRLIPYKLQRFVAKKLPGIKYHEVQHGGHLIIHDNVLCEQIFKSLLF